MKIMTSISAAIVVALASVGTAAFAQKTATPTSVKMGYFNLILVKASYPESAGSESLRTQAESQLRRDLEDANKKLQKAQEEKKSKEELEKIARDLQTDINAKNQALTQLVQTQLAIANQNIAQAVNTVARDKGLDLVVDSSTILAGGDKLVNNGVDVTEDVIKKLAPQQIKREAGTQTGATGATK